MATLAGMTAQPYLCSCCGEPIAEDKLGFNYPLPDAVADLPEEEYNERLGVNTDAVLTVGGYGSYFRVLLPARLDDGRTVTFGVWVRIDSPDEFRRILDYCREPEDPPSLTYQGVLCNAVAPWEGKTLGARVTASMLKVFTLPRIVAGDPPVVEVLNGTWSAREVLASRSH